MNMNNYSIIIFLSVVCFLAIFGRIFLTPIKTIFKIVINSFLGGILIYIINLIGTVFNFHIGLNVITAMVIGILGIPGAILLIIIKLFL